MATSAAVCAIVFSQILYGVGPIEHGGQDQERHDGRIGKTTHSAAADCCRQQQHGGVQQGPGEDQAWGRGDGGGSGTHPFSGLHRHLSEDLLDLLRGDLHGLGDGRDDGARVARGGPLAQRTWNAARRNKAFPW